MDSNSVHRIRVNGANLNSFHEKPVVLLGTITKTESGPSFQIKATDGAMINVRLKGGEPIMEPFCGVAEVYGIGKGKNLILADGVTTFPEAAGATFDAPTYNEMVKILHTIEPKNNPWRTEYYN